jgi:serine/threonine protein kinase
MGNADWVLVDTCVLLADPDVLVRIRQRGGLPFLTSTVLDELDYQKGKGGASRGAAPGEQGAATAYNARMILRELNNAQSEGLTKLPSGEALIEGDVLRRFSFKNAPIYLVGRDAFRSQSNNDAKIIELAKDYRMVLITKDAGMRVRAEALGVAVAFWTGPDDSKKNRPPPRDNRQPQAKQSDLPRLASTPGDLKPFSICTAAIGEADAPLKVGNLPEVGGNVRLRSGQEFRLGRLVSAGGEGSIYETNLSGQVCKIYHRHRLTNLKKKKIELMTSRRLHRQGICWPTEIVTNTAGEFVGYLMPKAGGVPMQKAMFVKPVLEKTFPGWKRSDLVNVARSFLYHIDYLHSLNIIVGDINPLNLLVTSDSKNLWIVDTDSFQIENIPCPVGTVNFTPPEIQGRNYSDFLRTKDHELFAVATMVFMILFPGKPPYSQQGGGSPADNIKSKNFPYPFFRENSGEDQKASGKKAPQGTWQFIWGNLPNPVREAFFSTFREDRRVSVEDWMLLLERYSERLEQGDLTNELFPLEFKVKDPVQVSCAECGISFTASKRWIEKLQLDGKPVWCPDCANRIRIERLAHQSRNAAFEELGRPAGRATSASASTPRYGNSSGGAARRSRSGPHNPANPPSGGGGGILGAILRLIFK